MRLRDQALVVSVALVAILLISAIAGFFLAGLVAILAVLIAALRQARSPGAKAAGAPAVAGSSAPAAQREASPSGLELAAAIGDPLIVCDGHGVVLIANAAASLAFGQIQAGELIALRFRSPEMHDLVEAALAGNHVRPIDYAERVPIERSFKVSVTPIGESGRFALHFRDQSETRRMAYADPAAFQAIIDAIVALDADVIMSNTKHPQESWEFLKWWSSAEIQERFGRELEALIGPQARWNTANVEAFQRLPWKREDLTVIKSTWIWARDMPVVLGGYFTGRHIVNAWNRVVMSAQSSVLTRAARARVLVRDSVEQAVKDINRELRQKQEEYGVKSPTPNN